MGWKTVAHPRSEANVPSRWGLCRRIRSRARTVYRPARRSHDERRSHSSASCVGINLANTYPMNARSRHHAVAVRQRQDAINDGNCRTYTYMDGSNSRRERFICHPGRLERVPVGNVVLISGILEPLSATGPRLCSLKSALSAFHSAGDPSKPALREHAREKYSILLIPSIQPNPYHCRPRHA